MEGPGTLLRMAEPTPTDAPEATEAALDPVRAKELVGAGEAQLIDVRTEAEHQAGHIASARHIPLERLSSAAGEIERTRAVIFYCRGGDRSAMAVEAFRASGWDAYSMAGGLVAWAERDLPLEPADGRVAERSMLPGD